MKRVAVVGLVMMLLLPVSQVRAQAGIVEAVKQAAIKVIKAVDLKVQRLQNETIWLQNAQKTLENTLSKLKLQEIGDWVEKQRALYDEYFQELSKVKSIIASYHRVKDIVRLQKKLVDEYKTAFALFQRDAHFSPDEIAYMRLVYEGILQESIQQLDQLDLVIQSFTTQMSDAKRLEIIEDAAEKINNDYLALQRFNNQNKLLSLQRSKDADEARMVRAMYGLK